MVAALTAAIFLVAALSWEAVPARQDLNRDEAYGNGAYQLAWWGSLYPRICLESAMELVEEPSDDEIEEISGPTVELPTTDQEEQLPVRIRWKCMDLF